MKKIWKSYFSFSKKERIGILVLTVIMTCFIAAPYCYQPKVAVPEPDAELASYLAGTEKDSSVTAVAEPEVRERYSSKTSLFDFDPNTVPEDGWRKLGIPDRTVRTILHYREKGGRFREPDDLQKIWGMRKEDAARLMPYVRIADASAPAHRTADNTAGSKPVAAAIRPIDINTATVEDWKTLPGIGEVLASRIVRFRERTGGFLVVDQVRKTYGITDTLFLKIEPFLLFNPAGLPGVNINTASAYELRIKLGLPYSAANAITRYREEHGPYRSINDITRLVALHDSVVQKLILRGKLE